MVITEQNQLHEWGVNRLTELLLPATHGGGCSRRNSTCCLTMLWSKHSGEGERIEAESPELG